MTDTNKQFLLLPAFLMLVVVMALPVVKFTRFAISHIPKIKSLFVIQQSLWCLGMGKVVHSFNPGEKDKPGTEKVPNLGVVWWYTPLIWVTPSASGLNKDSKRRKC